MTEGLTADLNQFVDEDVQSVFGVSSSFSWEQHLRERQALNIPKFYIDITNVAYGVKLPSDIPISDAMRRDHLEAIESTGAVIRHHLDHLPLDMLTLPTEGHKLLAGWVAERRAREEA